MAVVIFRLSKHQNSNLLVNVRTAQVNLPPALLARTIAGVLDLS
jgi:hypothetical protein